MKFTVIFATMLSISWAMKVSTEVKGKRDSPTRYQSSGSFTFGGSGSGGYIPAPAPAQLHRYSSGGEDGAVSIGAGYSVGGVKPSYGYAQFTPSEDGQGTSLEDANQQATLQLPALTVQAEQGSGFVSNDLSQLMSQLTHGLNSGQLKLAPFHGEEQNSYNVQQLAAPQYSLEQPKLQHYVLSQQQGLPSVPSYAAGTKGLGSYSATGPVLFSSDQNENPLGFSYGFTNNGHSGEAGLSTAERMPSGASVEEFGGSLGGAHGFVGRDVTYGSYGGSKGISLSGKTSFKPSAYVGSVGHSHSPSPSFGSSSFHSAHGLSIPSGGHSFGLSKGLYGGGGGISSKFVSPVYVPKKHHAADSFSSGSHSPPRTTYGVPTTSYPSTPTSSLSAASHGGAPYYSSVKYPSFGEGSSYKGALPLLGHNMFSSSGGRKYNFASYPVSNFAPAKDVEGSYSENSYNTIKYSEELKPHM